jgi:ATP-dependent exoDNAse (exonuclease V) beta subunit
MAMRTETSALDRVLDLLAACLTPETAKRLADLKASPELQARLDDLGDKSNEGELSPQEQAEYETYVHAIDFISILQSKARRLLANMDG